MRRTKIVCTIGPASASDQILEGLIRAGMNVARLNFSHGDYAFHRGLIHKIRRLERKLGRQIAILQDLPGPKIRIGAVAGDRVRLPTRQPFVLTTRKILGTDHAVSVDFPGLTKGVKKGDPILLGDGEIELEALQIGKHEVKCRIVVGVNAYTEETGERVELLHVDPEIERRQCERTREVEAPGPEPLG